MAQINAQIAKLVKEKEAIEAKEVAEVVKRIREAIAHYDLAPEDLFGTGARRSRRSPAAGTERGKSAGVARKSGGKVAIKYRDDAGNVWSGRGSQPRWLVAALAAGRALDEFRVDS